MGEVRVRTAGADDALVLAALALQCAIHRGGTGEQGFLDRYARAWLAGRRERPTWLAEAGEEHGGFLQARVLDPLPAPSEPPRPVLVVETLFVRPAHRGIGVGEQLIRAAVAWARDGDFAEVRVPAGRHTTVMVERVGFAADERAYRLELP
jgi:GNAT superfamily N-acetyltransferase